MGHSEGGHEVIKLVRLSQPVSDFHVIYVWMSVGAQQFGHASLLLSNGVYISWWPKGRKMKCGPLSKVGDRSSSLQEDVQKEEFEPDYKFHIPNKDLDVHRMKEYWKGWLRRGHYALLKRNCCSIVYKVLKKGGAPRSATLLWRPETLRRYLVIYLGGGSRSHLFWNLPGWDEKYKGKGGNTTLYIWKKREHSIGHASLCLENKFYISWDPSDPTTVDDEVWVEVNGPSSRKDDIKRIGREADIEIMFRPKYLDVSEMKRHWKEIWDANSFWLIYQILLAGGAPTDAKNSDYWNEDTLQTYIKTNFSLVTE